MIIGISGAMSVGKTTLVDKLRESGFDVRTLVARTVMRDHPINQDGDDGTQHAIIDAHLKNLDTAGKETFMDRCLVDGFVFTLWGAAHGKISGKCLADIYRQFYDNIKRYDYIAYLGPEFDIVPDGIRSTSEEFRAELCELYELVLRSIDVPVIRLSGTTNERLQQLYCHTGIFKC